MNPHSCRRRVRCYRFLPARPWSRHHGVPTASSSPDGREARIAIIGLPMSACHRSREPHGMRASASWAFDIDQEKIRRINAGESYLRQISSDEIAEAVDGERLEATTDFSRISESGRDRHLRTHAPHRPSRTRPQPHREHPRRDRQLRSSEPAPDPRIDDLARHDAGGYAARPRAGRLHLRDGTSSSPSRRNARTPATPKFSTVDVPKVVGADDPVFARPRRCLLPRDCHGDRAREFVTDGGGRQS